MPRVNTEGVRAAVKAAEPVKPKPSGYRGSDNGGPPMWEGNLPPNCPVRPVGILGARCVFLDALDQLTVAGPRELGMSHLSQYFAGDVLYLQTYWPRYSAKGDINKFSPEDVMSSLQRACAERGIWDDMDSVRGRGAWRREDGSLVYHCGDKLISRDKIDVPGVDDRYVYPARSRIAKPIPGHARIPRAQDPDSAGWQIYNRLLTWNWRRGPLDARFFFGLMVAGFLGGALRWRPSGWITGEAGTGKSYLQQLRREIMRGWSLNAADATSAGVFQHLEYDSIAVSLDEQESGSDNRKLDAMIELAREAASGDARLRGSAGHAGVSFKARSSFMFSSINMAPLKDQDMSRMVQLQLFPQRAGAEGAFWSPADAAHWGEEILRVCMDRWDRFDETLALYQSALARLEHDRRGQDTFGTLLACADLVLAERGFLDPQHPDDDPHVEEVWRGLEPAQMPEYADRTPNWLACIHHLLSSRPRDWKVGGSAPSIGGAYQEFVDDMQHGVATTREEVRRLNNMLALGGVAVRDGGKHGWELFIPNAHPQLSKIYEGTDWPGKANAPGGWSGALKAGDPAVVSTGEKYYVDGRQMRGVYVRLDRVMGLKAAFIDDGVIEEEN
ncbi:MAG: hypothetical protein AAFY82_00175 [Pseudomonadota bacterium]